MSAGRGLSARGPVAAFHQHIREDDGAWYCYACDFAVDKQDCPYNRMWRERLGLPTTPARTFSGSESAL